LGKFNVLQRRNARSPWAVRQCDANRLALGLGRRVDRAYQLVLDWISGRKRNDHAFQSAQLRPGIALLRAARADSRKSAPAGSQRFPLDALENGSSPVVKWV
jgi:hypothetical protein